jgi:hypothetical protein
MGTCLVGEAHGYFVLPSFFFCFRLDQTIQGAIIIAPETLWIVATAIVEAQVCAAVIAYLIQ